MPIVSTVEGDLIKLAQSGQYKAIAHGANCFCVMGAGIAPQIKKAWPEAYEADKRTQSGNRDKLGKYTMYHDTARDVMVFNAYTQYGGALIEGQHNLDYQAVATVFKSLNSLIYSAKRNDHSPDVRKVGIPMIGAGLAGGHWEAIKTIINLVTPDIEIEVVVYKP